MKKLSILLISLFLLGCHSSPSNWAKKDLVFIYNQLINNHPGIKDNKNPDFVKNLNIALKETQNKLQTAHSDKKQQSILKAFANSFNDTHLGIYFYDEKQKKWDDKSTQIKITKLPNQEYWISLPTFIISTEKKQYIEQIAKELSSLKNCRKIIFDLRDNRGGDSTWGSKLIQELFGKTYYMSHKQKHEKNISVDWRASQENLNHIKKICQKNLKLFGKNNKEYLSWSAIFEGVKAALKNNLPYYTEKQSEITPDSNVPNSVTAKIFVIIDKNCVSACLDFIDELYYMDYPITLIGQETKSDSLYMDIRGKQLPSKKGDFYFPMKVYRNRPRGNNQPYKPDIYANTSNKDELKKIIMQR